jgi:acyl carrier protein
METIATHIRRLVAQETSQPIEAVHFNSKLGHLTTSSGDLARLAMEIERVYDVQLADLQFSTSVAQLTASVLQLKKEAA